MWALRLLWVQQRALVRVREQGRRWKGREKEWWALEQWAQEWEQEWERLRQAWGQGQGRV